MLGTCANFSTATQPRHWRELKKVAYVAVAVKRQVTRDRRQETGDKRQET